MVRVMIVSNSNNPCTSAKSLLSSINYEIAFETNNGFEAVEQYDVVKPDILFLDLVLSQNDGLSVLKEIKKNHPESKIIIMTLLADKKLLEECYDSGATGCITIPYKFKDFLNLVTSIDNSGKSTRKTAPVIIE